WLLDLPRFGAINIHASLLPKYRGASPISASILEGNAVTGISYIVMNNKMDEGDIIFQSELPIDPTETSGSLAIKLSHSASNDINNVVYKYISGELVASPQDESKATYCSVLSKEDGKIDFEQLPQNLDRMVRAYHPWPGVWGMYNGKRVKLLPGTQVQMEGKKATSLANFKNGYPDFPIDAF